MTYKNISYLDAKELIENNKNNENFVIIDVRTPREYEQKNIPSAILINIYDDNFTQKIAQLDRDTKYLLYCRTGSRSNSALQLMKRLGFREVYNLKNGIINLKEDEIIN